jgi:hypothetical protein
MFTNFVYKIFIIAMFIIASNWRFKKYCTAAPSFPGQPDSSSLPLNLALGHEKKNCTLIKWDMFSKIKEITYDRSPESNSNIILNKEARPIQLMYSAYTNEIFKTVETIIRRGLR